MKRILNRAVANRSSAGQSTQASNPPSVKAAALWPQLLELEECCREVKAMNCAHTLLHEAHFEPSDELVAGMQSLGFNLEKRLDSIRDGLFALHKQNRGGAR